MNAESAVTACKYCKTGEFVAQARTSFQELFDPRSYGYIDRDNGTL
jgi:hypothetical protein